MFYNQDNRLEGMLQKTLNLQSNQIVKVALKGLFPGHWFHLPYIATVPPSGGLKKAEGSFSELGTIFTKYNCYHYSNNYSEAIACRHYVRKCFNNERIYKITRYLRDNMKTSKRLKWDREGHKRLLLQWEKTRKMKTYPFLLIHWRG